MTFSFICFYIDLFSEDTRKTKVLIKRFALSLIAYDEINGIQQLNMINLRWLPVSGQNSEHTNSKQKTDQVKVSFLFTDANPFFLGL